MSKILQLNGTGIVIRGNDIDTDQIIPARYMTAITFEGIEEFAFYDVRNNSDGTKKEHPFNDPTFKDATIMIVNSNFGCGSSREHAPQTIMRHGIQAILGESFAEIFAGNCTTLGIPVLNLNSEDINEIQHAVKQNPQIKIEIDIVHSKVLVSNKTYHADIPPQIQKTLTQGTWNTTDILLANTKEIQATYERLPYVQGFI